MLAGIEFDSGKSCVSLFVFWLKQILFQGSLFIFELEQISYIFYVAEAYSEPWQTSKMERFTKVVNS